MKTSMADGRGVRMLLALVFLVGCVTGALADGRQETGTYSIAQRGPHSRVWERVTSVTNAAHVRFLTNSYQEICTGLCFQDPTTGQWLDSAEQIDVVADGASATHGRHKVHFMSNANTAGGSVTLTTPDNETLSTRVYGLALYDASSGKNVLIAELKDSQGTIVDSNQVVWADAFTDLKCDIVDTYTLAGFEQNIVLWESPQLPDDFNPDSTWLQVYTEFFNPPAPQITSETNQNIVSDTTLDFGDMKIGVGQALLIQGQNGQSSLGVVNKRWRTINNRQFLIEEIPFSAITNVLAQLPQHASNGKPDKKVRHTASIKPFSPKKILTGRRGGPFKHGKMASKGLALNIDYALLSGETAFTFQSDTTYLVTGLCNLLGTNILEGGTVIKYTNNSAAEIEVTNLVCQTGPYRPAVFTSMNEDSIGNIINGSSGNPWTNYAAGSMALYFPLGTHVLNNVRFSHLTTAVSFENAAYETGGTLCSTNFQILDCGMAFMSDDATYDLGNGLIYTVGTNFGQYLGGLGYDYYGQTYSGANLTVHDCDLLSVDTNSYQGFTNCLFVQVTNIATNNWYTNYTVTLSSDSGVFQTVGAASHYLADSDYITAGTSGIGESGLTNIQSKTVYPPLVFQDQYITNDYTCFPQAQRDTNATPAIGYHYDPLDYVFVSYSIISNATVTVLPGTAIGSCPTASEYAIWLWEGANLAFKGNATAPAYFVGYNTVQEQATTNWSCYSRGAPDLLVAEHSGPPAPAATFNFTTWSVMAGDVNFEVENSSGFNEFPWVFDNCNFFSGELSVQGGNLLATNCLFRRTEVIVDDGNSNPSPALYNNLFLAGSLNCYHNDAGGGGIWTFRDNFFDKAIVYNNVDIDVDGWNAYTTTGYGYLSPTEASDIFLTGSPAYQTGALGVNYYPSGLSLINAGSRLASAAGLYHYTVLANNTIEGTGTVSIGYHYVAVGSNGLPLDTNGDGIPDYLEDANGNGVVDSGEIDWQVAGDLGLQVWITQPVNNSKVP